MPARVPPRARAASQYTRGTSAITARLTEVMMGITISASTTPHTNIDEPKIPLVLKMGMKPK